MIEIKPFTKNYLEDTSKIFIGNYDVLRKNYKELPGKYGELNTIVSLLKGVIGDNPSAIALEKGRVVGYMTGYSNIENFKGSGAGVYVPEWGHSTLDNDNKEKIYQELYRYLSKEWVSMKNYNHCITYYANDILLKDLFFNLSFGLLVIDGLRTMEQIRMDKSKDILVRKATLDDIKDLKTLDTGIDDHLKKAPIFLNVDEEAGIEETKDDFFKEDVVTFVAEKNGKVVSAIRGMLNKGPNAKTLQDRGTLGINFGYTDPSIRGSDIATSILRELINWGRDNGMERCTVDFESQNIEGVKFWLRHFSPICHSVIRKVDDRV